jgi:hypothetical protein
MHQPYERTFSAEEMTPDTPRGHPGLLRRPSSKLTCNLRGRQNESLTEWLATPPKSPILLVGAAGFEPAAPCCQSSKRNGARDAGRVWGAEAHHVQWDSPCPPRSSDAQLPRSRSSTQPDPIMALIGGQDCAGMCNSLELSA